MPSLTFVSELSLAEIQKTPLLRSHLRKLRVNNDEFAAGISLLHIRRFV